LVEGYEQFYKGREEKVGHVLKWPAEGSYCELIGNFDKNYTFQVSLVQAIILTQISEVGDLNPMSYSQIESMLGISKEELENSILPLIISGPKQLLTKSPDVKLIFSTFFIDTK
jgi:Cullin family